MVALSTRVITESSTALAVETRPSGQTTLADEISGFEERDDCFLTLIGNNCDFDPAFSNVEDGIRGLALAEDDLTPPVLGDGDSAIRLGEKCLRVEFGLWFLRHGETPRAHKGHRLHYRKTGAAMARLSITFGTAPSSLECENSTSAGCDVFWH
jgi:hypothetical protein